MNHTSRRNFLRNAALASTAAATGRAASASAAPSGARPNVLMICSDQFRTDFIGINRQNPSVITPNLDALAVAWHKLSIRREQSASLFSFARFIFDQPLCNGDEGVGARARTGSFAAHDCD